MKQSSLTQCGPTILDATCSFAKIWPKSATYRIDIRPEVNPDIVMDAKDLKFPNNHFDQIYCDPPHLMRRGKDLTRIKVSRRLSGRRSPDAFTRYGHWETESQWFEFIEKTNNEFFRCLKPDGILFYKITEAGGCTKPSDLVQRMTNFELLKDKITKSRSSLGKGKTHWLTFRSKKYKSAEVSAQ